MLWVILASAASAQAGPPSSITLASPGKVRMNGRLVPIGRAKPFLLKNPGSAPRARTARTFAIVGTTAAISGAALVVLGSIGISGDLRTNQGGYVTAGSGLVILGTGLGFQLSSNQKWRRSVTEYQAP